MTVPAPTPSRAPRLARRIAAVAAVWVAAAGGAIGIARWLDSPVGSGPLDPAQAIVAGPVVTSPSALDGVDVRLPPLALVTAQPLAANLAALSTTRREARLRELVLRTPTVPLLLQLGSAAQSLGDEGTAARAYRRALRRQPGLLDAQVGLVLVRGARGDRELRQAGATLSRLAGRHPTSQVVAFNRAWLAIYLRDRATVVASLSRARALDPSSPLGRTAAALLQAIDPSGSSRRGR